MACFAMRIVLVCLTTSHPAVSLSVVRASRAVAYLRAKARVLDAPEPSPESRLDSRPDLGVNLGAPPLELPELGVLL
jgi:hypothetical protein